MAVLADGEENVRKAICGKWSTEAERDELILFVMVGILATTLSCYIDLCNRRIWMCIMCYICSPIARPFHKKHNDPISYLDQIQMEIGRLGGLQSCILWHINAVEVYHSYQLMVKRWHWVPRPNPFHDHSVSIRCPSPRIQTLREGLYPR